MRNFAAFVHGILEPVADYTVIADLPPGVPTEADMRPQFPATERRIVWKLLRYWEERKGARNFPSLDDIDADEISELWPHCFVLDTLCLNASPYFLYLGPELARLGGVFLSGERQWTKTLLDKAVQNYRDTVSDEKPILSEEYLSIYDGSKIVYRSVLLPLSDDGEAVNFILGAASGATAALHAHLSQPQLPLRVASL